MVTSACPDGGRCAVMPRPNSSYFRFLSGTSMFNSIGPLPAATTTSRALYPGPTYETASKPPGTGCGSCSTHITLSAVGARRQAVAGFIRCDLEFPFGIKRSLARSLAETFCRLRGSKCQVARFGWLPTIESYVTFYRHQAALLAATRGNNGGEAGDKCITKYTRSARQH